MASTLDAINNWWGTTSGGVIATMVEGPVDFEPWIATYADDPAKAGRPGFWPVSIVLETPCSTECYVATTGSDSGSGKQLDPFLTIQKGLDTVSTGGTVNVAAGTYVEQVEIVKDLTLKGAGTTTVLQSPATLTKSFSVAGGPNNYPVVYVHDETP